MCGGGESRGGGGWCREVLVEPVGGALGEAIERVVAESVVGGVD